MKNARKMFNHYAGVLLWTVALSSVYMGSHWCPFIIGEQKQPEKLRKMKEEKKQ